MKEPIRISRIAVGGVAALLGIILITLGLFSWGEREKNSQEAPGHARSALPDFLDEELARALGRQEDPLTARQRPKAEGYEFLTGGVSNEEAPAPLPEKTRTTYPAPVYPSPLDAASERLLQEAHFAPVFAADREPFNKKRISSNEGARPETAFIEVKTAQGEYVVDEGTLIPARLITSLSTSAPGQVVAMITRDVYDRKITHVLIPAGSRLIGSYEDQIGYGDSKLALAWTRVIMPNGASITLPGFAAHDRSGEAALTGRLDKRFWEAFAPAMLVSALGAAARLPQALLQRQPSVNITLGQAADVGNELAYAARAIVQRSSEIRPVISLPAGAPVSVLVASDLVFEGPYE